MAAAAGWYGPLIDLSAAGGHVGDFVQLLVVVRRIFPYQEENALKGRTLQKTIVEVGDDTRSNFFISVWSKNITSAIVAGDVILIQNVKIVKFRNALEATTVQVSAVQVLLHTKELHSAKGTDALVVRCTLGEKGRAKLRRVAEWIVCDVSALHKDNQKICPYHDLHKLSYDGYSTSFPTLMLRNWKEDNENNSNKCLSVSELLYLRDSLTVNVYASISDVLMLCSPTSRSKGESSITQRLLVKADNNIAEDFVTMGCKLCGLPMDPRCRNLPGQSTFPLDCPRNSKYLHTVCLIYRPFLVYARDQSGQVPLRVKNNAAEILFANVTAESVMKCYTGTRDCRHALSETRDSEASRAPELLDQTGKTQVTKMRRTEGKPDFHLIWLILIKCLLNQGKNSPFCFEISVDAEKNVDNGRFELVSLTMPILRDGNFPCTT